MNAHERAEHLCREAERIGLDGPTESMVSDAFSDMEFNHAQAMASLSRESAGLKAKVEQLQETLKFECQDWADDDTRVKEIAAEFGIRDDDIPGEFQGVIAIAEKMAAKIKEANSANAELRRLIEEAPHDRQSQQICATFVKQMPGIGPVNLPCDCWKSKVPRP